MNDIKRDEREVSLFRNGRSQAVRIPKEFEIDADKVVMWKDLDGTLHLKPQRKKRTPREVVEWLRRSAADHGRVAGDRRSAAGGRRPRRLRW